MTAAGRTSHVLDAKYLARRINERKELLGLTWHEVCAEVGVTHDALWRIRSLARTPRGDTLVSILVWLGVTDVWDFTVERGAESLAADV